MDSLDCHNPKRKRRERNEQQSKSYQCALAEHGTVHSVGINKQYVRTSVVDHKPFKAQS